MVNVNDQFLQLLFFDRVSKIIVDIPFKKAFHLNFSIGDRCRTRLGVSNLDNNLILQKSKLL